MGRARVVANPGGAQRTGQTSGDGRKHRQGPLGDVGRGYYCRYDYEGVDKPGPRPCSLPPTAATSSNTGRWCKATRLPRPMFLSTSTLLTVASRRTKGIRFLMEDGSRVIFRLSGTAGSGATVRMYIEKYVPPTGASHGVCANVVGDLVKAALELSSLVKFTGMESRR